MVPLVEDTALGPALDRGVSDGVIDGLVAELAGWRSEWFQRPVAVIPVPSRSYGRLVEETASRVATVGRLPIVDVSLVDD